MLSTVSGAVTNIVLDPIFIFGLHWGIKGAAWATVAGQVLSFVLNAVYLLAEDQELPAGKSQFQTPLAGVFCVCSAGHLDLCDANFHRGRLPGLQPHAVALRHPVRLRAGHPHLRDQHRDEGLYIVINIVVGVVLGGPAHFGL